jgi:hypothetical protein
LTISTAGVSTAAYWRLAKWLARHWPWTAIPIRRPIPAFRGTFDDCPSAESPQNRKHEMDDLIALDANRRVAKQDVF